MMRSLPLMMACVLSLLAFAAVPELVVPHAQPGRAPVTWGASAVWQARGQAWFTVRTRADLVQGAGTLQRTAFDAGSGRAPPAWDASPLLDAADPHRRQIFTRDATTDTTVEFAWNTVPDSLRQLLDADGLGEARTAHLRGVRDREGAVFRKRASLLGDIVRSAPLIVGPPGPGRSEAQRNFAHERAGRDMAIYVGANDGMLHGFSAATGHELFAFIPSALHRRLSDLSDPAYQPRAWVDASASQLDVEMGGRWRTVLASGMGMGARGLFLLDISDPARFGQGAGAFWEFTAQDDPGIGHLHSAPLLGRLPAEPADDGWQGRAVALVSSGINPLGREGGALFMLALDKPAGQGWQRDVNYLRIPAGEAGTTLSPPAVVTGPAGELLHAYAGDLQGNLWHVDLRTRQSRRVFSASDAEGTAQAIAHAPSIVYGPRGGYLVIFGTGKLIEDTDLRPDTFRVQSLYAIHDIPGRATRPIRSRDELAERNLAGDGTYEVSGAPIDYFVSAPKRGWYVDFLPGAGNGERAAGSPLATEGVVVFQTVLPGLPDTSGGKGSQQGMPGRVYLLGALNGFAIDPLAGARREARTGALSAASPLQPLILIRGAADAGSRDPTGGITVLRRLTLFRHEPGGPEPPLEIRVRRQAGRLGWREINNWQDLREAALRQGG